MLPPRDTADGAHQAQLAAYRRMSSVERLNLAIQMCEEARQLSADGIRARHPEYADGDVPQGAVARPVSAGELLARILDRLNRAR